MTFDFSLIAMKDQIFALQFPYIWISDLSICPLSIEMNDDDDGRCMDVFDVLCVATRLWLLSSLAGCDRYLPTYVSFDFFDCFSSMHYSCITPKKSISVAIPSINHDVVHGLDTAGFKHVIKYLPADVFLGRVQCNK